MTNSFILARAGVLAVASLSCTQSPSARASSTGDVADARPPISAAHAANRQAARAASATSSIDSGGPVSYEGSDARGIPRYATGTISTGDSLLLRRAYGIEDPHRLYVSDSSDERILKYDTQPKQCRSCYVNSYRVGYVSVRRRGESWEQAERRVRRSPLTAFPGGSHPARNSTAYLDPDVRPLAEAMLQAARAAGFHIRVKATYRSPVREAFLMAEGGGRTHTLTSNHSYGRALDIVVDDGKLGHARTRRDWIAFRRWISGFQTPSGESFRILGRPSRSWDWAHVELPSSTLGFDTIDAAIARARACLRPNPTLACNFAPHLPASLTHVSVH